MILKDSGQEGSGLRAAGPAWVRLGAVEPHQESTSILTLPSHTILYYTQLVKSAVEPHLEGTSILTIPYHTIPKHTIHYCTQLMKSAVEPHQDSASIPTCCAGILLQLLSAILLLPLQTLPDFSSLHKTTQHRKMSNICITTYVLLGQLLTFQ